MNLISTFLTVHGWTLGPRLIRSAAFSRYINFYGQRGARLANDQTIYDYRPRRTYLIKLLSVLFFYAPELHLRGTRGRHALLLYI